MQIFHDLTLDKLVSSPGSTSELDRVAVKRSPFQRFEYQMGRSPSIVTTSVLDGGADNWTEVGFYDFTAADTDVLTLPSVLDIENGHRVRVVSAGTLPAGLAADTNYFVRDLNRTAKTCKLSATQGGDAVDITDAGTGTHTLILWPEIWIGIKADGIYDDDFLAVVKTYTVDVASKAYLFYLDTQTTQVDELLGNELPGSGTAFTVNSGTDVVTLTNSAELADGDRARLTTSGTLPAPLETDTDYYWLASSSKLAATAGGAAIDITDTGTGTHTITRQPDNTNDVAAIEDAMFEVSFRQNVSENHWRPSINTVECVIYHDVNDPATTEPTSTNVIPIANPMTTAGDIIIGGTGGAGTRLAAGDENEVLTIVSGVPAYAPAAGGGPSFVVAVTSTSSVDANCHGKLLECNAGGIITVTIDPQSTTAYPDNYHFWITNSSVNSVTFSAGSGVSIQGNPGGLGQYDVMQVYRMAENSWVILNYYDAAA